MFQVCFEKLKPSCEAPSDSRPRWKSDFAVQRSASEFDGSRQSLHERVWASLQSVSVVTLLGLGEEGHESPLKVLEEASRFSALSTQTRVCTLVFIRRCVRACLFACKHKQTVVLVPLRGTLTPLSPVPQINKTKPKTNLTYISIIWLQVSTPDPNSPWKEKHAVFETQRGRLKPQQSRTSWTRRYVTTFQQTRFNSALIQVDRGTALCLICAPAAWMRNPTRLTRCTFTAH